MNSKKLAFLTIVTLVIISSVESGGYLPGYRYSSEGITNNDLALIFYYHEGIIKNIEKLSSLIYNVTLQNLKISEQIFELLRPLNGIYVK